MSRRYLALWCPWLQTDRACLLHGSKPDDVPYVLVGKEKGALCLAAVDAKAASAGLRIGMTLVQARTLVPSVKTGEADPAADAAFLSHCAAACEIFTPLLTLRGTDGLILDITGCAHLFGGEAGLGQAARQRLRRIGVQTQAAIAGTPEAAWVLARYRSGAIAPPGESEAMVCSLPISALELESGTSVALIRAGFRTLSDIAARPSSVLSARFGEELVTKLRRVLGREDIRITPLRLLPRVMAERHFPEPIAVLERLMEGMERLACDVMSRLDSREEGGSAFEVSFFRADGAVRRLLIETAQATRDAASLMRLIRLKIETLTDPLDPGFGFDALRLSVLRSEPLQVVQQNLDGGQTPANDAADTLSDLVNRLVARFGREQVLRFIERDTHDPVLAGGRAPYFSDHAPAESRSMDTGHPPARPLTLFSHPQIIDVLAEVPDSPPLRFRWRRMLHEVTRAEGPERIAPEWWCDTSPAPATRDYYRVEDANGHRFWIFREGLYEDSNARPRWFVHGLFA